MLNTDETLPGNDAFRQALDALGYAVWIHDKTTIRYANPAGLRLLNASDPSDVTGKPHADFVHPDSKSAGKERRKMLFEHGQSLEGVPIKLVDCQGEVVYLRGDAAPITVDDKVYVLAASWPDHLQDRR